MIKLKFSKNQLTIIGIVGLVLLFMGGVIFYYNKNHLAPPVYPAETNQVYDFQGLKSGYSNGQCLISIQDTVYNISEYIRVHPSYPDLKDLCGQPVDNLLASKQEENGKVPKLGFALTITTAQQEFTKYKIGKYGDYIPPDLNNVLQNPNQLQQIIKH